MAGTLLPDVASPRSGGRHLDGSEGEYELEDLGVEPSKMLGRPLDKSIILGHVALEHWQLPV